MGIELPRELADVATQAGVSWPEADEERMLQAAQAWRDAETKISNLSRDADSTAGTALGAVEGGTGDAARRHWSTFVAPDSGHLTASARGCTSAADRLDHAANQVGAAKVEIVRNLVALAQNSDAANQAASSGYPQALAGLDTAVRGTAANVANIQTSLVSAVQPATGVDMSGVHDVVNANPGTHGPGPLQAATEVVTDTGERVVTAAGQTADRVTHDAVPDVTDTGGGAGVPAKPGIPGVGGPITTLPVEIPPTDLGPGAGGGGVGGGAAGPVEPGMPGMGGPVATGPVQIPPTDLGPGVGGGVAGPGVIGGPDEVPTPPTGTPNQTVQAGLAGPVVEAPAPGSAGAAPGAGGPGPGGAGPGGGQAPGFPASPGGGPVGGPPAGGGGGGALPPGGPPAAGGAAVGPVRPGERPAARFDAAGPPPVADQPRPDRARGQQTTAVPPGPPAPPAVAQQSAPRTGRDDVLALFWMHMFPFGHWPVAADRPARQLPPPPVELDYAAGMRFEPHDHPESDLVHGAERLAGLRAGAEPVELADGLPADHARVTELVEGHDPLGGEHERDWERRYLVRLGSVTPQGISPEGMEYAWPPAERYPEGGTTPGEPEVLAEDTVIDRFGSPEGRVFATEATPFAQRSLPPFQADSGYHRYRVLRPLPVWRAVSAAWFAQPGGGVRYRTTCPAADLVALGYLADVTEGTDE